MLEYSRIYVRFVITSLPEGTITPAQHGNCNCVPDEMHKAVPCVFINRNVMLTATKRDIPAMILKTDSFKLANHPYRLNPGSTLGTA